MWTFKSPLLRGLCYITPNRLMDQVSFPIRFACVYSGIHNTPEHSTYNLYTAPSPHPPSKKFGKGEAVHRLLTWGHTLLCNSFAGATTVRLHTTFPLWKYLTLANCSSKNFCPWTLFLDFHSNTTLTNDMETFFEVLLTPGANDAAILPQWRRIH